MPNENNAVNWPKVARALRLRLMNRGIRSDVLAELERAQADRILVACSGGADSVFMLCELWAHAAECGVELVVAHYNHRWRGEASVLDAAFVADMAKGLSCKCIIEDRPENEAAFTETTARALRLDFLRRVAQQHACGCIAFGHQQDDILETQLQRLARGSGTDGLAAPRPIHVFESNPTHLRPVLHLRAGEIRMGLNACGIPWREDSSNNDVGIARNALRHRVIPDLVEALSRDVSTGAARSRYLLEEDACALDILARVQFVDAYAGALKLGRQSLQLAPRALTRRALSAWLSAHNLIQSISAPAMDLFMDAVYAAKRKNRLSAGPAYIVLDQEWVWIELVKDAGDGRTVVACSIEAGESVILSTGALLETEVVELDDAFRAAILGGDVDVQREAFVAMTSGLTLDVRGWLAGDRYRPIGAPGSKKLKDWFIDRHIPQRERKLLPLVTLYSGEIIWVPGFAPADTMKISSETKMALRLTYQNSNPL
jgi:tRNA(Ile)-lysidine synthase